MVLLHCTFYLQIQKNMFLDRFGTPKSSQIGPKFPPRGSKIAPKPRPGALRWLSNRSMCPTYRHPDCPRLKFGGAKTLQAWILTAWSPLSLQFGCSGPPFWIPREQFYSLPGTSFPVNQVSNLPKEIYASQASCWMSRS